MKDRWHYFASYEYEREPNTVVFRPSNLPNQSFALFAPTITLPINLTLHIDSRCGISIAHF